MFWKVFNFSKLKWLTIEYFCSCLCPSHTGTFWNHHGTLWIIIFLKKYVEPLLKSCQRNVRAKEQGSLGTFLRSLSVGVVLVLVGFPARLPDIEPLFRRSWASSTREGWAGWGRLLSAVSWLLHVGFLRGSNDQVWRESALDSFLAACTCLSCWPLASAPSYLERSGERFMLLHLWSAPIGTQIWTLLLTAEGHGTAQVWSVPTFLLRGTLPLLWR